MGPHAAGELLVLSPPAGCSGKQRDGSEIDVTLKCPFAAPLTAGKAGCHNAQEVVRRGGSEYDCRSAPDHAVCLALFERLKAAALPAFGVEDDLLSMPHSTLIRIQGGGLLGLHRLLADQPGEVGRADPEIADVADLVDRARQRYGDLALLPVAGLTAEMRAYQLERRGSRRRS